MSQFPWMNFVGIYNLIGGLIGLACSFDISLSRGLTTVPFQSKHEGPILSWSIALITSAILIFSIPKKRWVRIYNRIILVFQIPVVIAHGFVFFNISLFMIFAGIGFSNITMSIGASTFWHTHIYWLDEIAFLGINLFALALLVLFNKDAKHVYGGPQIPTHKIGDKPSKKEIDQRTKEMYD